MAAMKDLAREALPQPWSTEAVSEFRTQDPSVAPEFCARSRYARRSLRMTLLS
ncbi:hypothetical protein [Longimicrobium sp.]|uniref:hypothetical protein n=1 Tax=Longimicrobium sp. TaxID=2029185 RepID=UPI002E3401B6|nr:hypothetical protein [Longimicrobium sp.]HEX6039207.1 hypothetical protein [Longimicrobium sp.]